MDNYEQKYKDALRRAKKLYGQGTITECLGWVFPEIKESEGERIKREILELVSIAGNGNQFEEIKDWLKKQGNIDLEHYEDAENEKRKFVGYGFLKCKGDFLSFKEGETYWLEYIGKDNYNVRSDNLLGQTFHIKPVELYTVFRPTTWLEKQDEQTHVIPQSEVIKTSDQELSDKVEPKFHEGEWLCENEPNNYARFIQILEIINVQGEERYRISRDIHNDEDVVEFGFVEKYYHKFDIQDAKDGDLIYVSTEEKGIQAIFHEYKNDTIFFHCYLCADFVQGGCIPIGSVELTYPLQKTHYNRFFEKMHEAGYEWNNEKKELKKIKSKTLDADKVIEWLNDQACLGWIEDVEVDKFITKFKKDFKL